MSAVDALQSCLAAEHAACYGYGIVGGVLTGVAAGGPDQARADFSYADHRTLRDDLTALIVEVGEEPVAAEPAYTVPFAVDSVEGCRRLARLLEDRSAAVHAYAVSQTAGADRELTATALAEAAVRSRQWGSVYQSFPGASEL